MRYRFKLFLFGVLCFVLSQIVIRLPLLNLLRGNVEFSLLSDTYPLLIGFLIALSAGGRIIYKLSFDKDFKLAGLYL